MTRRRLVAVLAAMVGSSARGEPADTMEEGRLLLKARTILRVMSRFTEKQCDDIERIVRLNERSMLEWKHVFVRHSIDTVATQPPPGDLTTEEIERWWYAVEIILRTRIDGFRLLGLPMARIDCVLEALS